jgi:hypothetical protein
MKVAKLSALAVLVQCATQICTYLVLRASAALARVTLARMSVVLAPTEN